MKSRRLTVPAALFTLAAAILCITGWFVDSRTWGQRKQHATHAAKINSRTDDSHFLDFRTWIANYSKTTVASQRMQIMADGLKLARVRRSLMEELMRRSPQKALANAVTLDVWKNLPPELQAEVEEPFSAIGNFRVLPVCMSGSQDIGYSDHRGEKNPDVVRYTEIEGRTPLDSSVFGRRIRLSTKESSPVQGIRLGGLAALREEVFHELKPQEIATAESLYPIANPLRDRDFGTGKPLEKNSVSALAGGKIFRFSNHNSLTSFNESIGQLDEKPGPHNGASVLFLPMPASGTEGAFNLTGAIALSDNLASAWTETKKKVLMLLCDFSDKTNASFPVVNQAAYATLLNTSVSNNIRDFSYGKTWIEATVATGVTRLPQTAAYYAVVDGNNSSRNALLLSDAKATYLTANPSTVYSNYDIVGVWFVSIGMKNRNITYSGLAGGSEIWIQGTSDAAVHVHEFGHNYGVGHSSFWIPPTGSMNPVDPAGVYEEYGDPFDVMGGGPIPEGVYHSEAKQRLNWLSNGQWADATASGSGTYRINRIDNTNTTGIRGLRVTKGANEYYWLSYRRQFANSWLKAGANIVWQRAGEGRSWLIDTTPGSLVGSSDRTDGSVAIGRTYADTTSNVYITPIARGGTTPNEYLDIKVNIGPFPGNVAPTVTLNGPSTIAARQTCIFSAQAADPNGDALAYTWDFGQGFTFDNNPTAAFAWNSGGSYSVKLTVSDMKGMTTVVTKAVTVADPITTWTARSNTSVGDFKALVASPSTVLAVGEDYTTFKGPIAGSTDGVTWTASQLGSNQQAYAGIWDGSMFLLAGKDYTFTDPKGWLGCVFTSTTGTGTWTRLIFSGSVLNGIAYAGGVYVAVGDNGTIRRSTNGTAWTLITSGTTSTLNSVAYGGGRFVTVGYASAGSGTPIVLTSPDGITWTNTTSGSGLDTWQDLRYISWANDRFIASGWYSKLRQSTDLGDNFLTSRTSTENTPGLAYGNGVWFAAGVDKYNSDADTDLVSTDGSNWSVLTTPALDNRSAAIFFKNTFITAGDNHSIRQSATITPSAIGYYNWREIYFPNHDALSNPEKDSDADGINNLLEYSLGNSPISTTGSNGPASLPQAVIVSSDPLLNDRISLQINFPDPAPSDVSYVVEASSNLTEAWTPLATKIGTGSWTWNPGGTNRISLGTPSAGRVMVKIGDSVPTSSNPKRFLRLRTFVNQ